VAAGVPAGLLFAERGMFSIPQEIPRQGSGAAKRRLAESFASKQWQASTAGSNRRHLTTFQHEG
jgi:hypothetical protein